MVTQAQIYIEDNPNLIFYAGDVINGRIEITVDKAISIKGLLVQIDGESFCQWSEVFATERFLELKNRLIDDFTTLEAGKYSYRFQCTIPADSPTSVLASIGHINYTASVIVERSWKPNITQKTQFSVIRPVNLNDEVPNLRFPCEMENSSTFCGFFGSPKSISMTTTLPMTAFVPGQTVLVSTEIKNYSRSKIFYVEIQFVKVFELESDYPITSTGRFCEVIKTEICKSSIGNYTKFFEIPDVPPSTMKKCRIVDVTYEFQIKAKVSGYRMNPKIKIPVVIGTVPYKESSTVPEKFVPTNILMPIYNYFDGNFTRHKNFPPSYEEAMKSKNKA